jgi:hypothetical protein
MGRRAGRSLSWLLCLTCIACVAAVSVYVPSDGPCKDLKSECLAWAEAGEVSEPRAAAALRQAKMIYAHCAQSQRPWPPHASATGARKAAKQYFATPRPSAVYRQLGFHVGQLLGGVLRCVREGQT